jgi:GNAT superfamily N-acetyltransferase
MPEIKYLPLSYLEESILQPLMAEEEKVWLADLGWDYAPIRQILGSFIRQKLLPGYAALADNEAIAYTYFLINQSRGIIGSLFGLKTGNSQEAIEELLSLAIAGLKDSSGIKRVEAQIMPFNNLNLAAAFTMNGFSHTPRCFLELDISHHHKKFDSPSIARIISWDSSYIGRVADMTLLSYHGQIDADICEDYRSQPGCESYLHSLVENPGCGIFLPGASYIALDWKGSPCGFIIACRISEKAGIIPQIAVHPAHQGKRLGDILMHRCLAQMDSFGFRTVSLTVTRKNLKAFEWYQRLGFQPRKDFGAHVWER